VGFYEGEICMRRKFPVIRKLLLVVADILVLVCGAYISGFIGNGYTIQVGQTPYFSLLLIQVLTTMVLLHFNGLFSIIRKTSEEVFAGIIMTMINTYIIFAIVLSLSDFGHLFWKMLLTTAIQLVLLLLWNYAYWKIERRFMYERNTLIVGSKEECERVIYRMQAQLHLRDCVRYVCPNFQFRQWQNIVNDIELVIICASLQLPEKVEVMRFCYQHDKQVFIIPDFFEMACSRVELDKIDDIPVFRPRYLRSTIEQQFIKRMFDICFSLLVLILLLPVFLAVTISIKLTSPGPAFYSQKRVGRYEKEFSIYKFRTMVTDAECLSGPVLAVENDSRITKLGQFLRATRLDELPQFVNVLLGSMSVVGPRPERPFFVKSLKKELPEYSYRHNVKPGITGLSQVYGKYNTTSEDKLIYDLFYIQNSSLITDVSIVFQTFRVLIDKASTEGVRLSAIHTDLAAYQIKNTRNTKG